MIAGSNCEITVNIKGKVDRFKGVISEYEGKVVGDLIIESYAILSGYDKIRVSLSIFKNEDLGMLHEEKER